MFEIESFFDDRTSTLTYVVYDPDSRDAVVIDPVLDYDPAASTTWTESVDRVAAYLEAHELHPRLIAETHAHADHLSGARLLQAKWPEAPIAIGERITSVQKLFKSVYGLPDNFPTDGRQFDRLLKDREVVEAGTLRFEVLATPGHTPADSSYRFFDDERADALFVGDTLFMPDGGSGRCDFPGGSASAMYRSVIHRIYTLSDDTEVYTGHDYQPGGRELRWSATVAEHRANNTALPADRSEADFVAWRESRDATLSAPKLLFQSIQVNIEAGTLPEPDPAGRRFLRIPINVFRIEPEGDVELADARAGNEPASQEVSRG